MKLQSPQPSEFDRFHSHTAKPLRVHMEGVLSGTQLRSAAFSSARVSEVAALFHDLGKLNPNFQPKVNPDFQPDGEVKNREYSHHAYLSAFAFLCFCADKDNRESLGLNDADLWRVLALIAHHHGHLPNFDNVLNKEQCDATLKFLATKPPLPASDFLAQWLPHSSFDVLQAANEYLFRDPAFLCFSRTKREKYVARRLDYFLETQFAFASLIESDKRDAGNNAFFRRADQLKWAQEHFAPLLEKTFGALGDSQHAQKPLNVLRTQMRDEAVKNLRAALENPTQSKKIPRTFALTAPTGAGKTFALLALAGVLREVAPSHAVVYGLPFLTITEQVEGVCRAMFGDEFVSRFDSRTQNQKLDQLQEKLDAAPQEERREYSRALLEAAFSAETFDAAFTVTTFAQIFETLLSNRNATLLKLPNFAQTVFLLDEIQALPPRLYVFFAAFLQAFCEKFDCYAIFSTATMPAFAISQEAKLAHQLFREYSQPVELLSLSHFENALFDRYEVRPLQPAEVNAEKLAQQIIEADDSCLIVLNTIADSRNVFNLLQDTDAEVILLNTHFTLHDRQEKIARCQQALKNQERVILVSTQLIEAGVDIDFPLVFRDLCPLPSLIQTAGRCNRNGAAKRGSVRFFELKESGKSRAELIYRNEPHWFLQFSRDRILATDGFCERDLLPLQKSYFDKANSDLKLGQHRLKVDGDWQDANLVEQVDNLAFAAVGSFQLIDSEQFGETLRYFVPQAEDDQENRFEQLQDLIRQSAEAKRKSKVRQSYEESRSYSLKIQSQLRAMAPDIVQFRVPYGVKPPASDAECCGVHRLSLSADYSCKTGISFNSESTAIL